MRIGVDLDNTIIRYEALFQRVAREWRWIGPEIPPSKEDVKRHVMGTRGNDAWTELQAEVYGPRLLEAEAFPGVEEFFAESGTRGDEVCVISHKTRFPARGVRCDLRIAALSWLEHHGWFDSRRGRFSRNAVEFCDTRAAKVAAIRRRGCEVFVDDLPEVFAEPGFPLATRKVLFDPSGVRHTGAEVVRAATWKEIAERMAALAREARCA